MRLTVLFQIIFLTILNACGGMSGDAGLGGINTQDPLELLAFTPDPIAPQLLFASYSQRAGRLSVIDPIKQVESWGTQAVGYSYAVADNSFEQFSLISDHELLLLTRASSKSFKLPFLPQRVSYASNNLAFGFTNLAGDSLHIIRSLGSGFWQEQTFTVPWQVPTESDVKLASIFSSDAKQVIVFNPNDMSYWRLRAPSSAAPLIGDATYCPGISSTQQETVARDVILEETNNLLFIGTDTGKIIALSNSEECVDYANAPYIDLSKSSEVLSIRSHTNNEIYVHQVDSSVSKLSYTTAGIMSLTSEYNVDCKYPFGSLPLSDDILLISCLSLDNDFIDLNKVEYKTLNATNNLIIQTIQPKGKFSGVGIDKENFTMYRMREGSLGTLESIDLLTGEHFEHKGLYLNDLLN